jgi:hypothetical protein
LSGRESTGDIDAVVMPPKQEITVEEEILDITMDPNLCIGQVPPSRRATSRNYCRSIRRTAVYGPVCTVVWEGGAARFPPTPHL